MMTGEFGADALYQQKKMLTENQKEAYCMLNNWEDIYENASGLGKAGNTMSGFTFQF
jgi:hypothetical protein